MEVSEKNNSFRNIKKQGSSTARGGAMKANDLREYGKAIEAIRVDPYRRLNQRQAEAIIGCMPAEVAESGRPAERSC